MQSIIKIEEHPLFKDLNKTVLNYLYENSRVINIKSSQTIYSPKDNCDSMGVILEGSIKFIHLTYSGREIVIKEMKEGDIFGELLCFQNRVYPNWIVPTSSGTVLNIPSWVLCELLKEHNFLTSFMGFLGNKSKVLINKIDILSFKKVEQRVAYYLLNIGKCNSVTELSSYIDCSREATSRALKNLKKKIDIGSKKELESILY